MKKTISVLMIAIAVVYTTPALSALNTSLVTQLNQNALGVDPFVQSLSKFGIMVIAVNKLITRSPDQLNDVLLSSNTAKKQIPVAKSAVQQALSNINTAGVDALTFDSAVQIDPIFSLTIKQFGGPLSTLKWLPANDLALSQEIDANVAALKVKGIITTRNNKNQCNAILVQITLAKSSGCVTCTTNAQNAYQALECGK